MLTAVLVDDEKLELEMLENHVAWEKLGLSIAGTAKNGKIGLELVERIKPDIVITDIKMPVLDGIQMSYAIRKHYPEIKIIFLSGYEEFSYAKEALQIGISDYVLKPIYVEDFEKTLVPIIEECERYRNNLEKFLVICKNLFAPFCSEEAVYNDLIDTGKREIYNQAHNIFKLAESMKVDTITLSAAAHHIVEGLSAVGKGCEGGSTEHCKTYEDFQKYIEDYLAQIEQLLLKREEEAGRKISAKIKKYIDEFYHEPISVESVSEKVFLSPGYARSIFKSNEGCTILEYMTRVRMEKALILLREGKYKVYQISAKVGYESTSYFCSIFQKHFGVTPNKYKRRK